MRILIGSNVYPPGFIGGAELVAHRQARCLLALGHDVRVFAGDHSMAVARHECRTDTHEGIEVTRVRLTYENTEYRYANFLNRAVAVHFEALLDRWRPDVVHFHNTTGLSLASYHHCHVRRIPVLITLHDHWGFCLRNTLITREGKQCRDISRCADCLPFVDDGGPVPVSCRSDYFRRRFSTIAHYITPSAYLATEYVKAGFPAERFEVISNGIDPALPVPPKTNEPCRFTTICHMGQHKGVHVIVEALRRLPRSLDWQFNFVGVGPLLEALQRVVNNEGLGPRVKFWGAVPNDKISEVFAQTDVCVLASIWSENEPVSIMEALAHGVPVVASSSGGIPELIIPGINGWLTPPGDHTALAAVFAEAIREPGLVGRLAAGARRTGTRWPVLRQVDRLLAAYEKAMAVDAPASKAPLVALIGTKFSPAACAAVARLKQRRPDCDVIPAAWLERDELDLVQAALVDESAGEVEGIDGTVRIPATAENVDSFLDRRGLSGHEMVGLLKTPAPVEVSFRKE